MKQIILIVSVVFIGCAPTKYLNYKEIKNHLGDRQFSKILIVGTGTSGTNLFLESVSDDLNKKLKSNNIKSVYHHLGNNQTEANRLFREIITLDKYDAILQFSQLDKTKDPIFLTSGSGSVPLNGGTRMDYSYQYRQIRFQQQFLLRYFDSSDLVNSIIDVNLDVNIDFVNPKDYSKLSSHIIRSLKIN